MDTYTRVITAILVTLLLIAGTVHAAHQRVAGTMTLSLVEQHVEPLSEAAAHALHVQRMAGITRVRKGDWMDGAEVVSLSFADLADGGGSYTGYFTESDGNGNRAVSHWSGTVTTAAAAGGRPQTRVEGTWTKVHGTGRYAGIRGNGTFTGHFTSATEYVMDFEGYYAVR